MMFIDYNSKLAWTAGWWTESSRPARTRNLSVSDIRASEWTQLIDPPLLAHQVNWTGNVGIIHLGGYNKPLQVDTSDWERMTEEEPVKKPRRGKRQGQAYDWQWSNGKWARVWV